MRTLLVPARDAIRAAALLGRAGFTVAGDPGDYHGEGSYLSHLLLGLVVDLPEPAAGLLRASGIEVEQRPWRP